jgi:hypothetical protein
MRKIEEKMIEAVKNFNSICIGNTSVSYDEKLNKTQVFLHGNCIAVFNWTKQQLTISSCGWETNTTKSRLNELIKEFCDYRFQVYQKQFVWYIQDELFEDGKTLQIERAK